MQFIANKRHLKMDTNEKIEYRSYGWLDSLAIGMSMACALHCLLTPVFVVALPVLAGAFWVQHDFHLWMLLVVLPTSGIAVFLGCRKHKDRGVLFASIAGLSLLALVAVSEVVSHNDLHEEGDVHHSHGHDEASEHYFLSVNTSLSLLGALLLSGAHARNFRLCRKARCLHPQPKAPFTQNNEKGTEP